MTDAQVESRIEAELDLLCKEMGAVPPYPSRELALGFDDSATVAHLETLWGREGGQVLEVTTASQHPKYAPAREQLMLMLLSQRDKLCPVQSTYKACALLDRVMGRVWQPEMSAPQQAALTQYAVTLAKLMANMEADYTTGFYTPEQRRLLEYCYQMAMNYTPSWARIVEWQEKFEVSLCSAVGWDLNPLTVMEYVNTLLSLARVDVVDEKNEKKSTPAFPTDHPVWAEAGKRVNRAVCKFALAKVQVTLMAELIAVSSASAVDAQIPYPLLSHYDSGRLQEVWDWAEPLLHSD